MSDEPVEASTRRDATLPAAPPVGWGMPLPPRWRLERPLGSGGQADVWLAFDAEVRQFVALKLFRPALAEVSRERLRREVRIGRELRHPNLLRLFELLEAGDRLALAMEWMPGGSLALRLAQQGPLAADEVVSVAEAVLGALACLHEHGILHRDVKPANLLLDADGAVRLADFGLAKPIAGGERLTLTAATVGSPGYMSPEQIRGEELTPASDLYALGVTLFELLGGRRPFEAGSEYEEARAQVEKPAPNPRRYRPDCPRWLARFVLRLLEKRPHDRFPSAAAALAALHRRQGLASPRVRRAAATAVLVGAIVAGAAWTLAPRLGRALFGRAASSVEAVGSDLRGLDAHGREVWRHSFASPVKQVERADLFGDETPVTISVAYPGSNERPRRPLPAEVAFIDDLGRVRERVDPARLTGFRQDADRSNVDPSARLVDLFGDGRKQLLLLCPGRVEYTSGLVAYLPDRREWLPLLAHSGFVFGAEALPGRGSPRLLLLAMNNRLCTLRVAAEVRLDLRPVQQLPQRSAELGPNGSFRAEWTSYTLLAEQKGAATAATPRSLPDGGVAIDGKGGAAIFLDRYGNPAEGPNAGRDLRAARLAFLRAIVELTTRAGLAGAGEARRQASAISREYGELLAEPPYAQVLAAAVADALDVAGDRNGALAALRAQVARASCEDLLARSALLEALDGRFGEARRLAHEAMTEPTSPSGWYRAPRLLAGIAIETRDVALLQRLIASWASPGGQEGEGVARALWARARLFWDRPQVGDATVGSWVYCPEGDAVAALVRWRLGASAPGDPEEMRELALFYPDMMVPFTVARAAALVALGRPAEALAALDADLASLGDPYVDAYMNHEFRELGAAVRVQALAAAGRGGEARTEALRVLERLRPGLLPARVVAEVLDGPSAPRRSR